MIVNVTYITEIPSEVVSYSVLGYGGTFNGGVKSTLVVESDLAKSGSDSVTVKESTWGESREYSASDALDVDGKPDWYKNLKSGAIATDSASLPVLDSNLKAAFYRSVSDHGVSLYVAGGNPLLPLAPVIDGEFFVSLKNESGDLYYQIYGKHDGFPTHRITINGNQILNHDPVALNQGPGSLGPPAEFVVSKRAWIKL